MGLTNLLGHFRRSSSPPPTPRRRRHDRRDRAPLASYLRTPPPSHRFAPAYESHDFDEWEKPPPAPPVEQPRTRRSGWLRARGRVRSNLEDTFRESPKAPQRRFGREPESTPSLKKLLAAHDGKGEFERKPHYHRNGRIRSNLDHLMRKDNERKNSTQKRRHSTVLDNQLEYEPVSLMMNEFMATPKDEYASQRFSSSTRSSARPLQPKVPSSSTSSSSASTASSASSRSSRSTPNHLAQTEPFPPHPRIAHDTRPGRPPPDPRPRHVEEPPPKPRPLAIDIPSPQQLRFSADAAFPSRPKPAASTSFARSQSNPVPPTQPGSKLRKRPPPLRTPTDDATGFACGVGATPSGIRQIAISRGAIPDPNSKVLPRSAITEVHEISAPTRPDAGSSRSKTSASSTEGDDSITEPKAYARFDMWGSKEGHSSGSITRIARRPIDKEQDEYWFEEASQSSFGETESPSRRAARNGIVPIERQELAEVVEDHFVFGADGSFNDGGFIISNEGLVEAPERVMRKTSDGVAVEGVPTSSNNMIIVKSLDEFRKSFTFKAKNGPIARDGPSTLGRGAAGRVYLAVHEPTGNKIAVKEINVYDDDKREQLKKELQTLINHQSRFLVRSFGAFYDGAGVVHVTLEYMDRGALSDVVQQRGRVPEPVLRKIAEHCLRGLGFLHDNHILHRDVKTGNILLSRKLCRAKLSDFGLARDLHEGSSVANTFVGTFAYMSPERLHAGKYSYASDIWGLGISILECVMGRYPFEKPQDFFVIMDGAQSNPSSLVQGTVSPELVDFIRLCTNVDPQERPEARELLDHDWICSGKDDANALREWLDSIPKLRCEDAEVSSELAFARQEKTKAKIRAKAQETCL